MNFKSHIESVCYKKANKTRALFRDRIFPTLGQAKVLADAKIHFRKQNHYQNSKS